MKPQPINGMCNPLCPFFKCSQRALVYSKKFYRGKPQTVAMCRMVGDECIGYKCQYAYCEKRALLPDGRCAAYEKEQQRAAPKAKDMFEELAEEELNSRIKSIMTKRIGKRDLELE